jgi:hypothetical protein
MRVKKPVLLVMLLALVLVMAIAPGVLAKSASVAASGSWTWVTNDGGTWRDLPNGKAFLKLSETGQWSGTFTASDVYEPFSGMITPAGESEEVWFLLWIHFKDATVNMGGGEVLHGDMMMFVKFRAATWQDGATWRIENGTGDLQHLGGHGTLVWTETGMDYSGTIWTNK